MSRLYVAGMYARMHVRVLMYMPAYIDRSVARQEAGKQGYAGRSVYMLGYIRTRRKV